MTCTEIDDVLEAYMDGDLPPGEHRTVSEHLSACVECRRKLALAERIASELQALPQVRCPDDVARETLRRVAESGKDESAETGGRAGRPAGLLSRLRPDPFPWKLSIGLAAALLLLVTLAAYPPAHWFRGGQQRYTQKDVEQAEMVIGLAFGYVDHATRLAENLLQKQDVPDKVIVPIRKGLEIINPSEKKEKTHEKRSFIPYSGPLSLLCITGMGK